jgi:DNA-directed RNA polymerase I, II, and III subunit RPABC2
MTSFEWMDKDDDELVLDTPGSTEPLILKSVSAPHTTSPLMTKFEKARVLSVRGNQISAGAPVMVDPRAETNCLKVSELELAARKIPAVIRRTLPNGEIDDWPMDEMIIE